MVKCKYLGLANSKVWSLFMTWKTHFFLNIIKTLKTISFTFNVGTFRYHIKKDSKRNLSEFGRSYEV